MVKASVLMALAMTFCTGSIVGAGGREIAAACVSCHGFEGRGGGAIPALAGRSEDDLLAAMQGFQQPGSDADGVTIMPRLMRAYDDAEIRALARYFAERAQ